MKSIVFNIPETMELNERDARLLFTSRLYETNRLTLGQAAEMVGLSKSTFMELISEYGVSLINHPVTELDNDISNARDYSC